MTAARLAAALLCLLGAPAPALAHGDLVDRIHRLDAGIAAAPGEARLYLKRAALHRDHEDWPAALADIAIVRRLAPTLAEADFREAAIRHDQGKFARARALLDSYLAAIPASADGRVLRARVLNALGEPALAVADLDAVVAAAPRPSPDRYLERARILRAMGPDRRGELLAGLDEGVRRLGPVVALIDLAIEVTAAEGRAEAALRWLDRLPAKLVASPEWLARRGDIYAAAGRGPAAKRAYREALAALEALPPRRRNRAHRRALETRLRGTLADR